MECDLFVSTLITAILASLWQAGISAPLPSADTFEVNLVQQAPSDTYSKVYSLELLDGEEFTIALVTNRFIGDDLAVHYVGREGGRRSVAVPDEHCYFAGTVLDSRGERVGWASVSGCDGLHGILDIVSHGSFTIEPSETCFDTTSCRHSIHRESHSTGAINLDHDLRVKRNHEHKILERHINLAVVIDEAMIHYHGNNESIIYIMRLINTVAHLFADPSIGSIITLSLVKIVMTETRFNYESEKLRDAFCYWQQQENADSAHHHDLAVLVTRQHMCEESDSCGILGSANLNSVCTSDKNCVVVRDTGLSTAFTIAHEMGHSVGIEHDDTPAVNCTGYYIMASSFKISENPHLWSTCSRDQLIEFLRSPEGSCLSNSSHSTEPIDVSMVPLVGVYYSLDEQCVLLFGENATSCHKTDCTMLWCDIGNGQCDHTQFSPPAPGTACSTGEHDREVCYQGQCLPYDVVTTPVDGGWSEWSEWSACSATCGNGIQDRHRECSSPKPKFGGSHCEGQREMYRSCNLHDCPSHSVSYRDMKCAELGSNIGASGHSHEDDDEWFAVNGNLIVDLRLNPCTLYCQQSSHGPIYALMPSVDDGVPCVSKVTYDEGLCVKGECIRIGCEGLNTPAHYDQCGVLCGDNSTCSTTCNTFTPNIDIMDDYQDVTVIPSGSYDVSVEESGHSQNHIALMAKNSGDQFNKPLIHSSHRHFSLGGGSWYYNNRGTEYLRLVHDSSLTEDVTLQVYVTDATPLSYCYTTPIGPTYYWSVGQWTTCSVACGNGTRTRSVMCVNSTGGIVDEDHCDSSTRPLSTMTCQEEPCDNYEWMAGPWSKCECSTGSKTREVSCHYKPDNSVVTDDHCSVHPRPITSDSCTSDSCPIWIMEWSPCSVTCGCGVQTKVAVCKTQSGAPSSDCNVNTKPPEEQKECCKSPCQDDHCENIYETEFCEQVAELDFCSLFDFQENCCKSCCESCS